MNEEDIRRWVNWMMAQFAHELEEQGMEVEQGDTLFMVHSEDEAEQVSQTLFGLPVVIKEPEPDEDDRPTIFGIPVFIKEPEPDDRQPTNEAALFFSPCRIHYPLSSLVIASVAEEQVGYIQVDHGEKFNGEGVNKICYDFQGATNHYHNILDQLVEADWTLAYRGPRNQG